MDVGNRLPDILETHVYVIGTVVIFLYQSRRIPRNSTITSGY